MPQKKNPKTIKSFSELSVIRKEPISLCKHVTIATLGKHGCNKDVSINCRQAFEESFQCPFK